jgi:glucokinase
VIGVDLGGTNVRAVALDSKGQERGQFCIASSRAREGAAAVVAACVEVIRGAVKSADCQCSGVGMAVPGHIDTVRGVVLWAPNFGETVGGVFRHFADVPLAGPVAKEVGLPVVMGNDANLAALGEYRFGCGENRAEGLVMFTLGTGIGGGVVLVSPQLDGAAPDGKPVLLVGSNGGGAELGHTIVAAGGPRCGCGAYGCLEALVNANAIVLRGQAKLEHNASGILARLCGNDPGKITPKLLSQAAEQGDECAFEVWRETGFYLGLGIANAINTFVPEIVAIGGNIAQAGAPLMDPAIQSARDAAIPTLFSATRIVRAKEDDRAGVLGGAALALRQVP